MASREENQSSDVMRRKLLNYFEDALFHIKKLHPSPAVDELEILLIKGEAAAADDEFALTASIAKNAALVVKENVISPVKSCAKVGQDIRNIQDKLAYLQF